MSLTLGTFVFQDFEIPEHIAFGGEQRLAVKKLVGGARVIDAMGYDPHPVSWSGVFFGPQAMARAQTLKAMAIAGQAWGLTWDQNSYQVVIQAFEPDFRKAYHIPYTINCEVVTDNFGTSSATAAGLNDSITADAGTALGICTALGNSPLTSSMSTLSSAISAVSNFANAANSTIAGVLGPLQAVQTQTSTLIAQTEKTLANVATVGGMLPNNPIAKTVAQISAYTSAAQSQPMLVQLSGVLGRIGVNLGQVNSSVRTVTVPGGNLYDIAAKQYGDASAWKVISQANPVLNGDPQLSGITTLVIPPYNSSVV